MRHNFTGGLMSVTLLTWRTPTPQIFFQLYTQRCTHKDFILILLLIASQQFVFVCLCLQDSVFSLQFKITYRHAVPFGKRSPPSQLSFLLTQCANTAFVSHIWLACMLPQAVVTVQVFALQSLIYAQSKQSHLSSLQSRLG